MLFAARKADDKPFKIYLTYPPEEFRANVYQGGAMDFNDIPATALTMAQEFARKCRFNDVGLDLLQSKGNWYVIEANMMYGREGLKKKNMVLMKKILH